MVIISAASCFLAEISPAASVEWKPIVQDELKLTSVEGSSTAPAVCLFSEVETDDIAGREHRYVRIKVLTEEGRAQGNLTLYYVKDAWNLTGLHVRTVQPDGTVAEDPSLAVDSVVVRYKRFKTFAKVLALPDVRPGTIIEYQYDFEWDKRYIYSQPWVVDGNLFTLRASFQRRRRPGWNLRWVSARLPKSETVEVGRDGLIRLELKNVAASRTEDSMPPEAETRPRVDFYYYFGQAYGNDLDSGWADIAKSGRQGVDRYLSGDHGLDALLSSITSSDENAEVRLRKIYDRVQTMRNLSFEDEKTQAEFKRQNLKPAENIGDVIKHGYGWHGELDLLFLALLKRSGFDAWFLDVARRDAELFFLPESLSLQSLPGRAVLVKLGGKDYFLDPATPLLPFGLLPWGETSVKALRLDAVSGGLIPTLGTAPADVAVERKALLSIDENGGLEGAVTVTYSGFEAFNRRFEARRQDNMARRRTLESELQSWIPENADVSLRNQPDWSHATPELTAEFHVRIKEWATHAGHRLLCREGIFSGADRSLFQSDTRMHDMYFPFPAETRDTISLTIPATYRLEALPASKARDLGYLSYKTAVVNGDSGTKLEISRCVTLEKFNLARTAYNAVHAFYQELRAADESQIVLSTASAAAAR